MPDQSRPPSPADGRDRPMPVREPADERQRAALAAVVAAARSHDLDPSGAGIWRAGSAVLVALPAVPALARVDEPTRADDARRQVAVARLLRVVEVEAVRTVGPVDQPLATSAGPLTLWAWVPPVGRPAGPRELGQVARRLHDRTRDLRPDHHDRNVPSVPAHDSIGTLRAELARAAESGTTSSDDLDRLHAVADRLTSMWPDAHDDPLGAALVHGDLHRSNVVAGADGPVLADLELAGWGPASIDVAPQVVAVRRYAAEPAGLEEFLAGYGADPRGWPGLEVLIEAYELWVTTWAVANRGTSERSEREAQVRLDRWRSGSSAPWSLR